MEHLISFFIGHKILIKRIVMFVFKLILKQIRKAIVRSLFKWLLSNATILLNSNSSSHLLFALIIKNNSVCLVLVIFM